MIRTIFDEIVFEKEDFSELYAQFFIQELASRPRYKLSAKEDTTHGVLTEIKISNKTGIYIIYKDDNIVYIGHSDTCIRNRLGRFLAAIRGTEREDENHSGAYKYVECFGRDTTGLSFKYVDINPNQLQFNLEVGDIEKTVIQKMKPFFNNETFYNYSFEKTLKVTSKEGIVNAKLI